MAQGAFRGKSLKAVAIDVADGMITINPLVLKKFDKEMLKELNEHMIKAMTAARNEKVELHNPISLRKRNLKLQRLNNAIIILKNIAREKKIPL